MRSASSSWIATAPWILVRNSTWRVHWRAAFHQGTPAWGPRSGSSRAADLQPSRQNQTNEESSDLVSDLLRRQWTRLRRSTKTGKIIPGKGWYKGIQKPATEQLDSQHNESAWETHNFSTMASTASVVCDDVRLEGVDGVHPYTWHSVYMYTIAYMAYIYTYTCRCLL
jgi:hypothetical protein